VAATEELGEATRLEGEVPPGTDRVMGHLRAAHRWGADHDPRGAHRLARDAAFLSYARQRFGEAQDWFESAAALAPDPAAAAEDHLSAAFAAGALFKGSVPHAHLVAAAEAAVSAGDAAMAARALAIAVSRVERMPALFDEAPSREETHALLARAHELAAAPDAQLRAQLAVADAWISGHDRPNSRTDVAEAAVAAARAAGDPILESDATDALAHGLAWVGELRRSTALSIGRHELIDRMSLLDVRAGAEILDLLHMGCDAAVVLGDVERAVELASQAVRHPLAGGIFHLLHRELVVAYALSGRFDDALAHADSMREAWERAGGPTAGWMRPATSLAAMICGLRGDEPSLASWRSTTEAVGGNPRSPGVKFAPMRLALHRGELDGVVASLGRTDGLPVEPDGSWAISAASYGGYAWLVAAEAWALGARPDSTQRLEEVRQKCGEHLWCEPTFARIDGQLRGDPGLIQVAADGFEAVGAHFEAAATRALLAGRAGDEGRRWLDAAACEPPAAAGAIS
jgi:hypothetical protein